MAMGKKDDPQLPSISRQWRNVVIVKLYQTEYGPKKKPFANQKVVECTCMHYRFLSVANASTKTSMPSGIFSSSSENLTTS